MIDNTTKAIIEYGADRIGDMIANDETIDRDELHNRLYNDDYFIIGIYHANELLKEYDGGDTRYGGVFGAIETVREYETEQFGEFNTEIAPESIANMLAYIIGERALNDASTYADHAGGDLSIDDLKNIKSELIEQMGE